jgi:hypothetical protein
MKTSFKLNDRVLYTFNGKDWAGTIVNVDRDGDYRVQFDNPEFGGWSDGDLENVWAIGKSESNLKPLFGGSIVPASELKRIYDVACDDWQKKIAAMIKPFADHAVVSQEMAEAMLKAATPSQRPVVEDVLKNAGHKFEAKPEYFEFDHNENVVNTYGLLTPLMVYNGLAEDGFEFKEIGFVKEGEWTPVLVREDGTEENITGLKLRFKRR